jgi:hypothetical protein
MKESYGEDLASHTDPEGFVKLLRLRRSSGERVLFPDSTHPLGGSLRACHFGPTLETVSHLLAVV